MTGVLGNHGASLTIKNWCCLQRISRATSHIFTCIRDKDGWSIKEKHDYKMETLRIEKAGGDISKRKIFKMYFGTTVVDVKDVSC